MQRGLWLSLVSTAACAPAPPIDDDRASTVATPPVHTLMEMPWEQDATGVARVESGLTASMSHAIVTWRLDVQRAIRVRSWQALVVSASLRGEAAPRVLFDGNQTPAPFPMGVSLFDDLVVYSVDQPKYFVFRRGVFHDLSAYEPSPLESAEKTCEGTPQGIAVPRNDAHAPIQVHDGKLYWASHTRAAFRLRSCEPGGSIRDEATLSTPSGCPASATRSVDFSWTSPNALVAMVACHPDGEAPQPRGRLQRFTQADRGLVEQQKLDVTGILDGAIVALDASSVAYAVSSQDGDALMRASIASDGGAFATELLLSLPEKPITVGEHRFIRHLSGDASSLCWASSSDRGFEPTAVFCSPVLRPRCRDSLTDATAAPKLGSPFLVYDGDDDEHVRLDPWSWGPSVQDASLAIQHLVAHRGHLLWLEHIGDVESGVLQRLGFRLRMLGQTLPPPAERLN